MKDTETGIGAAKPERCSTADELIADAQAAFQQYWQDLVDRAYRGPRSPAPSRGRADDLRAAIHYSLSGSGKRVRPILCLLASRSLADSWDAALPAAAAVEMVHTYSLIHDDLPCMDDDNLRRGRPTVHKAFNEAVAVLAGDALLTDAFTLLAESRAPRPHLMIKELAEAAGSRGMAEGQALDMFGLPTTSGDLQEIHQLKTGRLLGAATALGGLAVGADTAAIVRLRAFGEGIGLAFQIVDDLLDPSPELGKTPDKDQSSGKPTFLSVCGHEQAQQQARQATDRALGELDQFPGSTATLRHFALHLLERRN